ncbi:MAG: hypothetical protein JSS93_13900 [Bacteroidetes bacterium]|nr:hypothetical protein [Bacteroidota bacterium]
MKKTIYKNTVYLILFSLSLCLNSCSIVWGPNYWSIPKMQIASDKPCQTQGGVNICIEMFNSAEEYKNSIYKNLTVNVMSYPLLSTVASPSTYTISGPVEFYKGIATFKVTITNNTDHIINLADSRLAYISNDNNEPVFALSRQDFSDNVDNLPVSKDLYNDIKHGFPATPYDQVSNQVHSILVSISKQAKILSYSTTEILPNSKASGYAVFPISISKMSTDGKVSFIDIITKSDKAANTVEKTRIDFDIKILKEYWKNALVDKNVRYSKVQNVTIDQAEYEKGLTNPEQFTWNKTTKTWIKK